MRSLNEVKSEIQKLLEDGRVETNKTKRGKIVNRIEFLNLVKNYLLGSPGEEFIKKEVDRVEGRINAISSLFDKTAYKEPKTAMLKFERENKIPHLRDQVRALRFILN